MTDGRRVILRDVGPPFLEADTCLREGTKSFLPGEGGDTLPSRGNNGLREKTSEELVLEGEWKVLISFTPRESQVSCPFIQ